VDFGIAGGINSPDGYLDYHVSPENGTLVLAEGAGSPVGTVAAVRTIERAMEIHGGTRPRDLSGALGELKRAVAKIPKIMRDVRTSLGDDAPDMDATPLAAQIVDNRIIYAGHRPMFVYRPDGTCVRLIGDTTPGRSSSGIHYMEAGVNIILMIAGREADDDWQAAEMANNISWARADNADNAQALAEQLHQRLTHHDYDGAILVSVVDVAEWQDSRSALRRRASLAFRWPSMSAEWLLTKTVFRGRRQRELHETNSRAGRVGRAAAFAGDVVTNAALVSALLNVGSHIPVVRHAVETSVSWFEHLLPQDTGKPSLVPAASPRPNNGPNDNHNPTNSSTVTQTPRQLVPAADTYGDVRVANRHDPTAHNGPSTVTNWSQDDLYHSAIKAGLSPDQANTLSHNQTAINKVNSAFLYDKSNANNAKVLGDKHTWTNEGDTYSGTAQTDTSDELAVAYRHQLGLDPAPAPPAPATPPAQPVAGNNPVAVTAIPPINRRPNVPDWTWQAAEGAGAVGLGALTVMGLRRRSRRRRKNRELDSQATILNRARTIHRHRAPKGRAKKHTPAINSSAEDPGVTAAAWLGDPPDTPRQYVAVDPSPKHGIPYPAEPETNHDELFDDPA